MINLYATLNTTRKNKQRNAHGLIAVERFCPNYFVSASFFRHILLILLAIIKKGNKTENWTERKTKQPN